MGHFTKFVQELSEFLCFRCTVSLNWRKRDQILRIQFLQKADLLRSYPDQQVFVPCLYNRNVSVLSDHELIDQSAEKIIETAKRNGAKVSGPIPLPTEKQIVTILRAVHKYKDSREQFERRTHKRLIDIINPNQATIEALTTLDLPAGVEFEVKL